ncbi:MAG: cbb3-type cytochrome c oxidase subunit I [Chloroflexi bacterium]|nr:cbb3-type cytochrome c oxidase subunit I [Chloroflexota bacterium]
MKTLKILLTSAYIRGLIGQAIFMFGGIIFIDVIRSAMGLEPNVEPGIVFGSILSVFGFLLFAGVLTDWLKWIVGKKTPLQHGVKEGMPEWSRYLNVDVNHKVIGIQYGYTSIIVLLVGGLFALTFRLELVQPGMQALNHDQYNTLFSAHGIVMIASILFGYRRHDQLSGTAHAGRVRYGLPRLNAFSYWVGLPAVVLIIAGMVVGGWDTGWVGYPTLTFRAPLGVVLFLMGFYLIGFSSIASAINLLITVAYMRAPGMSLFRMPIFVWGAIAASLIQFSATQTVGVALTLNVMERVAGLTFSTPLQAEIPSFTSIYFGSTRIRWCMCLCCRV